METTENTPRHLFTVTRGAATFEIVATDKPDALAQSRYLYRDIYGDYQIPVGRVVAVDGAPTTATLALEAAYR